MRAVSGEGGAAAVETAIMLPFLSMIIFGLIVFGFLFHDYLEITHAAREGVRWAALEEPYSVVLDKAKKAAPGINWDQAELAMVDENGADFAQATINDQGEPVTVTVTYNLPDIVTDLAGTINNIMSLFYGGENGLLPETISSSATQRIE